MQVVRMDDSRDGEFTGALVLPPSEHEPYLHEQEIAWAAAEPFSTCWSRHRELHRNSAA